MLLDLCELKLLRDPASVFAEEKVRHHRVEVEHVSLGLEVPGVGMHDSTVSLKCIMLVCLCYGKLNKWVIF
jgi:hypothetical protein